MKSLPKRLFYLLALCLILATTSSCNRSTKKGCPVNEQVHVKQSKKGKVKGKAKSGLLTKKMTRRSKKKKKSKK